MGENPVMSGETPLVEMEMGMRAERAAESLIRGAHEGCPRGMELEAMGRNTRGHGAGDQICEAEAQD